MPVLTMHAEDEYLLAVLEAGGSGYVRKTSVDEDLISAIRTVARDEGFVYPSAAKLLRQGFREEGRTGKRPRQEADRTRARSHGDDSGRLQLQRDRREALRVTKTVDTYRLRIMEKLGLARPSELVRVALNAGAAETQGMTGLRCK